MKKRILLTAFRNTSAQYLIESMSEHRILLLPNDKMKDSEILIEAISIEKFDYVICIGQKPNIQNKVHVESTARAGESRISTDFNCAGLVNLFEKNGICGRISSNAGTSYCNQLYLNGLQYIFRNTINTQMVFVHIPFMKNIADFHCFRSQFWNVLEHMQEGEPWTR